MSLLRTVPLLFLLCCLTACAERRDTLFEPLEAPALGIDFENTLPDNDTVNILYYEYLYNGGGVGVGDFDRDGLPDLFFTGNLTSSRLYLQRKPWTFEDITEAAGLTTDVWCAGVNVADVDGNGWEDIYLATLNPDGSNDVPNRLYLNQGNGPDGVPRFVEAAAAVGIADSSYSTHSSWIDFDADGDLDLYVVNNGIETYNRNLAKGSEPEGKGRSRDRLYRNVTLPGDSLPHFEATDLVRKEGWGLGAVAQDFNHDGRTDLYVSNDFISDDFFLETDSSGQLRDQSRTALPHTSLNSMGVDAADINNDGYSDMVVVDMLPDDNLRRKTMIGEIPYQRDRNARARGYSDQYMRNTLQLNNQDGTFSDIALLAGVAATDWSWAPLLADLDNDGHRDLFISNGYPKDITDRDFVDFSQLTTQFGTEEKQFQSIRDALGELGGVYQANALFRNRGDLTFAPTDWLPDAPTYSNGAAFVDLDGDGDLDLVTNNIDQPVGIYRNLIRERQPDSTHYLALQLTGPPGNPDGLGAKVYLRADTLSLYAEQQRQRGYLSTVTARLHFGLGGHKTVDSLLIIWPDGRTSQLGNIAVDRVITADYASSLAPASALVTSAYFLRPEVAMVEVDVEGLPEHLESAYSDFDTYALALRDNSHDGPALTTDRAGKLFFGGAAGQPVTIHDLRAGTQVQRLPETEAGEATVLLLFDYDGDGDEDLYVGNGSSEFASRPEQLQDQLYENVNGTYRITEGVLPELLSLTSAAVAADLEGDGDLDLFVGSRLEPGQYPMPPKSYVLRNDDGRFVVAEEVEAGMVTAAIWQDLDGDGRADLATVGEYAAPTVFLNRSGKLEKQPADPDLTGWWYSLTANDLDGDGDLDLLAGNVGTNVLNGATPGHPLVVHAADYDGNGMIDPIVTTYIGDEAYPVHPRNTLGRQLPGLKRQFPDYATYGGWTEAQLPQLGEKGIRLEAREFRSAWLENDGSGHFTPHFLPTAGQTAPLRAAVAVTLADGRAGLLAVQNDYAVEVLGGRLDAGTGFAVTLDAAGTPEVLPHYWSVRGDARSVVTIGDTLVVGTNNDRARAYVPQRAKE